MRILIESILMGLAGLLLGFLAIYAFIYRDVIAHFTAKHPLLMFAIQAVLTTIFCIWRLDVTYPELHISTRIDLFLKWLRK